MNKKDLPCQTRSFRIQRDLFLPRLIYYQQSTCGSHCHWWGIGRHCEIRRVARILPFRQFLFEFVQLLAKAVADRGKFLVALLKRLLELKTMSSGLTARRLHCDKANLCRLVSQLQRQCAEGSEYEIKSPLLHVRVKTCSAGKQHIVVHPQPEQTSPSHEVRQNIMENHAWIQKLIEKQQN